MDYTARIIQTNGINLEVVVEGQGPLCILVHGWPELWLSWRHQIAPLVEAGYRVAVPNVRGYGGSDAPEAVEAYRMEEMAADVVGLMDTLGEEQAILIGHDWGAPIVWSTALLHPERVSAVVGMSVPHMGRGGPMPPTQFFKALHPERFFYILHFQTPTLPEAEFERDVKDALTKIYFMNSANATSETRRQMRQRRTGYLDGMEAPKTLPGWLNDEELNAYTAAFERSGFRGGLNRYRCMDRDWHDLESFATARIAQPALFIAGEHDSVLRYAPGMNLLEMMDAFYDDLRAKVIIPGAGHWVQQEQPESVNKAVLDFLGSLQAESDSA